MSAPGSFTDALAARVLLCDGAMGTLAQASGFRTDGPGAELCVLAPALVASLHRRYLDAGADVIETHTYGASRLRLARFGLAARTREINRAGAAVAVAARDERAAEGRPVWVAGSVSPASPARARSGEDGDRRACDAAVREQVEALVEGGADGGVDLIVLETFTEADELARAVRATRAVTDLPIVAQATFFDDDRHPVTAAGDDPAALVASLAAEDLAALGTNCTLGPQGLLGVLRGLRARTGATLVAQPNAGLPHVVSDRTVRFAADADHFARYVGRYVAAGARLVGGCCGTTPEHTAAARAALDAARDTADADRGGAAGVLDTEGGPADEASRSRAVLDVRGPDGRDAFTATAAASRAPVGVLTGSPLPTVGRGVVAGWLDAAPGTRGFLVVADVSDAGGSEGSETARSVALARSCAEAGAGALWAGRSRTRRAPVSPAALALAVADAVDLDVAVTLTCWDTGRPGLQADLLGLHASGLRTVVCETGNPPVHADQPVRDGTWEVDSVGLLRLADGLNRGVDADGHDLAAATDLALGARFTPGAADPRREADRILAKVEAGARFLVSRPVYELERARALLGAVRAADPRAGTVPVLLTVAPLRDFAHAEHLRHEVPGVVVPEPVLERMRRGGRGGGVALAEELAAGAAEIADGIVVRRPGPDAAAVLARLRAAAGAALAAN